MIYNVYTGDGNHGTSLDRQIEAEDLDGAIADYMSRVSPKFRELFQESCSEEDWVSLIVLESPEGWSAGNGGAYFCCEICLADTDPRA